VAYKNITLKGC